MLIINEPLVGTIRMLHEKIEEWETTYQSLPEKHVHPCLLKRIKTQIKIYKDKLIHLEIKLWEEFRKELRSFTPSVWNKI